MTEHTRSSSPAGAVDLLAYWRWDNYVADLDEGAGFHFNSPLLGGDGALESAINAHLRAA